MKKLFASLSVCALLRMQGIPVFAAERELDVYSVAPTTYVVTETSLSVDIENMVRIHHIIVSVTDIAVAQTVTFYELGSDTNTVTSKFVLHVPSTTAAGDYEPVQIPFPIPASPWAIEDLVIRKSSTGSGVQVSIFYR